MADDKQKRCFMITPLGEDGSEIRRKAEGVIAAVVKPVVEKFGYELICPHEMSKNGSITQQIIGEILYDELVIANLTGLNANVMYELAIRHATKKPVITISERAKLPFDINEERTLFYDDNMLGVIELKRKLEAMMADSSNMELVDNPIYRAKFILEVQKSLPNNKEGKALSLIISQLGAIRNAVSSPISDFSAISDMPYSITIENCLDNCAQDKIIEIKSFYSVQDVLNKVYFAIESYVAAYKYMQSWVLREVDTGLYMIMYEVTSLVPAKYIFKPGSKWQVVEWNKYKIGYSKHFSGYGNTRHYP